MTDTVFQPKFIKPFSKGQITLPKNYRDYLGIDEKSWLRISLFKNQIVVQPVKNLQEPRKIKPKIGSKAYLKILSKIKGEWLKGKEYKKIRSEVEKRLADNEKNSD